MARKIQNYSFSLEERHRQVLIDWAAKEQRSASQILRRLIDAEIKRREAAKKAKTAK